MRKRIVPALLALVLILSIVPTAFAAVPMTLVQQTTGDPNKEFVYYIRADDVEINVDSIPHCDQYYYISLQDTPLVAGCAQSKYFLPPGLPAPISRYIHFLLRHSMVVEMPA